ncbi:GNAT family N-acetyltransferase [Agromyces sp. LHK192]|uniref:GNAT family N-acetyltransferase n=1 Tax=Agromyces sp. LHK192 TaxID=2498704 RepID=UPI000FDC86BD|nr:GNAT family N-acetyltransferase [Agromyces sp. LHK192]
MSSEAIAITRNTTRGRYEVEIDGEVAAFAMYREEPGRIVFTHTVVRPEFEGRGIGSRLASHVLDEAVEHGLEIVPECPFIASYIEQHPEYSTYVAA